MTLIKLFQKHQISLILIIIIFIASCGDSRKDAYEDGKKVGFEQGFNKGYEKGKQDAVKDLKDLKQLPMQQSHLVTIQYLGALFIIVVAVAVIVWIVVTKKGAGQKELQNINETLKQMQGEMNEIKTHLADLTIQSADRL